jgi:hypothetical protein
LLPGLLPWGTHTAGMTARKSVLWGAVGVIFLLVLFAWAPDANAQPEPIPVPVPAPGGGPAGAVTLPAPGGNVISGIAGGVAAGGISVNAPSLAPASAGLFLCPGVGKAAGSIGAGGGYCDFDFEPVMLTATTMGVRHTHCEWGGFTPFVDVWNCWRVPAGQPDHPQLPDPDIIPDGWGVPWAINGPTPNDQWPPPGLAPAGEVGPPPPPAPQVPSPAEPLQPGPPGLPPAPPGPEPSATAPVPFGEPVGPPPGPFTPPAPPPPEPPPG